MGLLDISGKGSASKSKKTTNTNTTRNLNERVTGIGTSTGRETSTGLQLQQGIQTALGADSIAQLQELIRGVTAQATPEAQVATRDAAIAQTLEAGMSDVIALGTNAGAYDSTVQGTAGQRLASRAAIEGQQAQNVAMQNFLGIVTGLLGIEKGAISTNTDLATQIAQLLSAQTTTEDTSRVATERTKSKETSKTTSKSGEAGFSGSFF